VNPVAIVLMDGQAGQLRLDDLVDAEGFAEILGVKRLTIHTYRKLAANAERELVSLARTKAPGHPDVIKARRRLEQARARQIPEPIVYVAGVPMWSRQQADDYRSSRPSGRWPERDGQE
jgi:hypothetical protein